VSARWGTSPWARRRVVGVAHRGASRYAPENTLAAFQLALEHGARAVECDVHRTRDGHLVVLHDPTVDRTTNGRGRVDAMTLADLRQLDAGAWFDRRFSGERIPLVDEVLQLLRGRALLQLEIKNGPVFYEGIEEQVLAALRRWGMEDDTLVISFDHPSLRTLRELSPRVLTGVLYTARLVDGPAAARDAGADALGIPWEYATSDVVAQAHRAGLGCFVWTVDDEDVGRACLARGVDALTSNDTLLLRRVLSG